MPSVQIKDFPDDVHAEFRRRAAVADKSLQEYLLRRLEEEVDHPDLDELLDRAGGGGGHVSFEAAGKAIRDDRGAD